MILARSQDTKPIYKTQLNFDMLGTNNLKSNFRK